MSVYFQWSDDYQSIHVIDVDCGPVSTQDISVQSVTLYGSYGDEPFERVRDVEYEIANGVVHLNGIDSDFYYRSLQVRVVGLKAKGYEAPEFVRCWRVEEVCSACGVPYT